MKVRCQRCDENLDDRDKAKDTFVCWKCGFKTKATPKPELVEIDDDDDYEWYWRNQTIDFDYTD